MIWICIDTSIFRQSPRLDSPEFKVLEYLCRSEVARVFVPWLVRQEFVSNLRSEQEKRLRDISRSLKISTEFSPDGEHSQKLVSFAEFLEASNQDLIAECVARFDNWIERLNGLTGELSVSQAQEAWNLYFNGEAPFADSKNRKDIPDGFIFAQFCEFKSSVTEECIFVTGDKALLEAIKAKSFSAFSELGAALKHPTINEALINAVISEHSEAILEKVEAVAKDYLTEIAEAIQLEILADHNEMLSAENIPEENDEIYITNVYVPHKLLLGDFEHFGAGVFTAKCKVSVALGYIFFVSKWDAFELEPRLFSITPHNEHFYEAETESEFACEGRVELDFGEAIVSASSVGEIIDSLVDPNIQVDNLGGFRMINPEPQP